MFNLPSVDGARIEVLSRSDERYLVAGGSSALIDTMAGFNDSFNPNAVEVYVHRIRKKLEGAGLEIAVLRGIGYVLRASP